jgi:hypothetical protein
LYSEAYACGTTDIHSITPDKFCEENKPPQRNGVWGRVGSVFFRWMAMGNSTFLYRRYVSWRE